MTLDLDSQSARPSDGGAHLVQLVYRSRSCNGAESALQMSDILDQARLGNARDGITGVLTAVDGRFVQIIEGSEDVIDQLMIKLARDPRHTDLTIIERRATTARLFSDWDMVSPRLAATELSLLALLINDADAGVADYAAILGRAVAQQEAVLEGRRSPRDVGGASEPFAGLSAAAPLRRPGSLTT